MPATAPAVFRLTAAQPDAAEADLLGVWSATPLDVALDFSLETAPPDSTWWLADLPADPAQAGRVLRSAEHSLALAADATTNADRRLAVFVDRAQKADGISFSLVDEVARPEQELGRLLGDLGTDPQTTSFGIGDRARSGLAEAGQQFGAYLERLEQQLSHFAWVETHSAGRLVARTAVDWTGSVETQWYGRVTATHTVMHRRTLGLALQSRHSLLRTLAVVTRNAIRLAKLPVLLTTPGGALLALPLAWRFIQDLRNEQG